MGLTELLAGLERQAADTAKTELEAARAEAARIEAEAEKRRFERMSTGLEEQAAILHADAERVIAEVRRGQRRRMLEARQRLLERIFARAEEIVATEDPPPADALANEVREALRYLGDRPAIVYCAPSTAERLRALLRKGSDATVQPDPALRLGFRAQAADGSVVVDHTPKRRLAARRPRLAIELLRRIEPPS